EERDVVVVRDPLPRGVVDGDDGVQAAVGRGRRDGETPGRRGELIPVGLVRRDACCAAGIPAGIQRDDGRCGCDWDDAGRNAAPGGSEPGFKTFNAEPRAGGLAPFLTIVHASVLRFKTDLRVELNFSENTGGGADAPSPRSSRDRTPTGRGFPNFSST